MSFICRIGQRDNCLKHGCGFEKATGEHCKGYVKQSADPPAPKNATHFWIHYKHGYIFSSGKELPVKNASKNKYKYMGYTSSIGWPKIMSTGRKLYQQRIKTKKKKRR